MMKGTPRFFNKAVVRMEASVSSPMATIANKEMVNSAFEMTLDQGLIVERRIFQILTASEAGINLFRNIEDPIHFKTAMLNAKEHISDERGYITRHPAETASEIPALITQLDDLRKRGILTDEEFQQKKADLLNRLH